MKSPELKELYVHILQDTLSAEAQIQKALPKVIEYCTSAELKRSLTDHLEQTKGHVSKVKSLLKEHAGEAKAEHCEGMEGLLKEVESAMEHFPKGELGDCAVIVACQKVEHYEICTYGTLRAIAARLSMENEVGVLSELLYEEFQADDKLSIVARTLYA